MSSIHDGAVCDRRRELAYHPDRIKDETKTERKREENDGGLGGWVWLLRDRDAHVWEKKKDGAARRSKRQIDHADGIVTNNS